MKHLTSTISKNPLRLIQSSEQVSLAFNTSDGRPTAFLPNNLSKRSITGLSSLLVATFFLFGMFALTDSATAQSSEESFGQNFTKSPRKRYGGVACQKNGGRYNGRYRTYFTSNDTSMTITAGNDCRQVYSGGRNGCVFDVGDNGLTEISFDFDISGSCHLPPETVDWFSFFISSVPWTQHSEVDFIESKFGGNAPGNQNNGLNTNFGGIGTQVPIFNGPNTGPWKGTVTATFSGTGDNVSVSVSNSVNTNVARSTLSTDTKYVFILNTTQTTATNCTVTISNVRTKGTVDLASNNCVGLQISN